jgi:hypothetical protein
MILSTLTPCTATDAVSNISSSFKEGSSTTLTLNWVEIPLQEAEKTLSGEISTFCEKGGPEGPTAATERKEMTYSTPLALTIDDKSKLYACYSTGS